MGFPFILLAATLIATSTSAQTSLQQQVEDWLASDESVLAPFTVRCERAPNDPQLSWSQSVSFCTKSGSSWLYETVTPDSDTAIRAAGSKEDRWLIVGSLHGSGRFVKTRSGVPYPSHSNASQFYNMAQQLSDLFYRCGLSGSGARIESFRESGSGEWGATVFLPGYGERADIVGNTVSGRPAPRRVTMTFSRSPGREDVIVYKGAYVLDGNHIGFDTITHNRAGVGNFVYRNITYSNQGNINFLETIATPENIENKSLNDFSTRTSEASSRYADDSSIVWTYREDTGDYYDVSDLTDGLPSQAKRVAAERPIRFSHIAAIAAAVLVIGTGTFMIIARAEPGSPTS
ncbi:MAG: hypothetical protein AAF108_04185 [Planctomycetota bacterium]